MSASVQRAPALNASAARGAHRLLLLALRGGQVARGALQRLQRHVQATLRCMSKAFKKMNTRAVHARRAARTQRSQHAAHAPMCTSSCSVRSVSASVAAVDAGAGVDKSKVNTLRRATRVSVRFATASVAGAVRRACACPA